MRLSGLGVLSVLLNYGLARLRPRWSVRRLVSALSSSDEDTSTLAYIALVRLGPRVADALLEVARCGESPAEILSILGDQGDLRVLRSLQGFLSSKDPSVVEAARESIELLESNEDATECEE